MLCNTCKNKHICKHYEYFNNIIIDINIKVEKCELYSNNANVHSTHIEERPAYRQPLPSTYIDPDDNIALLSDEEDEERVYVDVTTLNNEPKTASIVDLFMKGENEHDKKKK